MATETIRFTTEQKEAWNKAKVQLKSRSLEGIRLRALHIAMSELRAENGRKHKGPIETPPKNEMKLQQYNAILSSYHLQKRVEEWKEYFRDPGKKKLFIITRNDLSSSQKAVQAAHCAAQFQKEYPGSPWINGTMILLVPRQDSMAFKSMEACFPKGSDFFDRLVPTFHYNYITKWREPDQDNRITSIAILADFYNNRIADLNEFELL
jgi:hypothetical protein